MGRARNGRQCSEKFHTKALAVKFRGKVDAAGQRWPAGWTPGLGVLGEDAVKTGPTLAEWFVRAQARNLTVNSGTLEKYRRQFEEHIPAWLADKPQVVEAGERQQRSKPACDDAATAPLPPPAISEVPEHLPLGQPRLAPPTLRQALPDVI